MRTIGQIALLSALLTGLVSSALSQNQEYPDTEPLLIQKDARGGVTERSQPNLLEAHEAIERYGSVRVWVSPRIRGHGRAALPIAKIRALQMRIVKNLERSMPAMQPVPQFPTSGIYLSVSVDLQGIEALANDDRVEAFWILMPRYAESN